MSGHAATQILEAVRDLVSHREAWRSAIEIAIEQASDSRDDMDEKGYLKHELAAFDQTFSVLNEQSSSIVTALDSHAELVKALEPFADAADKFDPIYSDAIKLGTEFLNVGMLRAARAALATLTARKVG